MSFSVNVKSELTQDVPHARHCRMAELAAIVTLASVRRGGTLTVKSENETVLERLTTLFRKLKGEGTVNEPVFENRGMKKFWSIELKDKEFENISEMLKLDEEMFPDTSIYRQPCCKRAFLRCAFLVCGSVSDPEKDYHLEFVADNDRQAELIRFMLSEFGVDAKMIHRKKYSVVYLKDGESIIDVLNIMEAHVSLMDFENVRIVKEVRNSVNRRVNCESANIDKTVKASNRQIDDINYLVETIGLDSLGKDLKATAILRLQYPESTLAELGALHDKPVGKSGVNHRLQKMSEMAEQLRNGKPVNEKMED